METINLVVNKKVFLKTILVLLITVITLIGNTAYAIDTEKYIDIYNKNPKEDGDLFSDIGAKVIGIIQVIGMSVAIISLTILGAKYMYSAAASDKAEIKSKLIPYVIGAVILFFASSGLNIIIGFARDILK